MRDVAVANYKGRLQIFDIEYGKEKFDVKAHAKMGNSIEGIGGKGPEYGAPELVTGGADGCVRVLEMSLRYNYNSWIRMAQSIINLDKTCTTPILNTFKMVYGNCCYFMFNVDSFLFTCKMSRVVS